MATFKFLRDINIHWNGYEIKGPAETVFSIPDQLYEEFESDIRHVEPSLTWIDTNEFQTLENQVSTAVLSADLPIAITTSTTGKTISLNSGTALNGYLLVADGAGGTIWNPASTSGLTSVVGVSPISTTIAGGVASVSLAANYQTAGTYVNAVIGTSPASVVTASGTSTVSIDQSAITAANAATNAQTVRTYVKNTTGTTIPKGSAVYVSGATGDNALISLSTASTEVGSSKTLGITAESIATDAFGYVVESGYLTGIDTSGISAGTSVWLGTTPGSLVYGAPPAEPNHSVYLGVVIREQQINGSLLVKVQNGYEIDELHDVSAASPSDGDILQYKSSSSLWTKASISNAGIASSVHTHDYQASGNYQTAGTYVNAVVGTSPASVSTTSGTSTVSIIASSIDSSHIANNAVVAAKIANSAVGITKIDSGSATSGQVLTANGSSGVSFTTLASGGLSVTTLSATVNNTIPKFTEPFSQSIANMSQRRRAIAYDQVNNHIYVAGSTVAANVGSSSMVYKIDATTGSQLASVSIAMSTSTTNREMIVAAAWGSDKLCLLTNSSVSTVAPVSRWFILNSSLSTLATGNVHSTTQGAENFTLNTGTPYMRPFLGYDSGANQFLIVHTTNAGTTASGRNFLYRIVDPGTYTTGYYILPNTISVGASTVVENIRPSDQGAGGAPMVYVPSLSRWVTYHHYSSVSAPNTPNIQILSFSQTTTTTGIFALTGRQVGSSTSTISGPSDYSRALILNPSGDKLYGASPQLRIFKINVSDISSNINTTSSSGFTYRQTGDNTYTIDTDTGHANSQLKMISNGTTELLILPVDGNASTDPGLGAVCMIDNPSQSTGTSGDGSLIVDTTKNIYRLIANVSSTETIGGRIPFDGFNTTDNCVSTLFDVGSYNGSYYIVVSSRSTLSNDTIVRVNKLGDFSKSIITFHNTSDPLTEISISPYTNSDTTPIYSTYPSSGYGGNDLFDMTATGTYWRPAYGGSDPKISLVMEPGSSLQDYIGAATSTTLNNTVTLKVLKSR